MVMRIRATGGSSPPATDGGVEQGDPCRAVGRPRREPVGRRPAPGRPQHHRRVRPVPRVADGGVRRPERPPCLRREARRRHEPQPHGEGRAGLPVRVRDGRERPLPRGARRVAARGPVADAHDEPREGARAVRARRGRAVRVPDGRRRGSRVHRAERLARRRAGPLRRGAQARDALRRGPRARAHRVPVLGLRRQRRRGAAAAAPPDHQEAVRVVLQVRWSIGLRLYTYPFGLNRPTAWLSHIVTTETEYL